MSTDGELLQRYVTDHSEAAFAELVRRHLPLVYSTALRQLMGDAHRARDVTQTVFTALAHKAATLTGRPVLAGWLFLGTHHAATQAIRTDRRRQTYEQEAHAMQQLLSSSAPAPDWDRVRPVLDDALRELNAADREAVLLRFFQQRPFAEIGATLHLSEDAARMRVERALDKLHALLGRRGIKSTATALATVFAHQAMAAAPAGMAASVTGVALSAASTTSSGTALAATLFMNKPTLIVSVAALAAAILGFREFNRRRAAEAMTIATQAELAQLRAQEAENRQRVATAEQKSAAVTRELERPGPESPSTAPTPVGPPSTTAGGAFFLREVPLSSTQSSPRTLLAEAVNSNYAPFYRQLGLTPDQQKKFVAIMTEFIEHRNELFGTAVSAGTQPSSDLLRQVSEQASLEREAKLREAFGDGIFQAFQRFEARAPLRTATSQLAATLFQSGTPLSPMQADQLESIMMSNLPASDGKIDVLAIDLETTLTQAKAILPPEQLLPFQRTLENMQMAERSRRAKK